MSNLKILFMTPDMSHMAARLNHKWLEDEMSKIADCKMAGLGTENARRKDEGIQDVINRLYDGDSPDWVIVMIHSHDKFWYSYKVEAKEDRDWKIACHCGDMHNNQTGGPDEGFLKRRNNNEYDALLMKMMRIRWRGDPDFCIKNLKPKLHHLPFHVNPDIIKPHKGPKVWDVNNLGATEYGPYPLRFIMNEGLPQLCDREGLKFLTASWPPGSIGLYMPMLKKDRKYKFYVGQEYYDAISKSKIMAFDSSRFGYAVKKYYECGFLKTMMLTDTPMDAESLHLIPGWNFAEINQQNWSEKLLYYLKHENERLELVENAYDTMMKYHTTKIRAKQLLTFLEENR